MSDITQILLDIERGNSRAAEQLLPLVYDELRKLAADKLAHESPGQTLQGTALVHEAYLRLVGGNSPPDWNSRGHFFAAAAEAMRRILIENARRKSRIKHGGEFERRDFDLSEIESPQNESELVALDEALDRLAKSDPQTADLVKLRFFVGLTNRQVAEILGISPRKADMLWAFARSWLRREMEGR